MCNLPDVKFENFAAARSCLQSTLAPTGAVIRALAISADQNGKSKWRVNLTASGNFPAPTESNFVAVRAVLNQHVPARGVLSTITLVVAMSTTEIWEWEVAYTIKKVSRLRAAISAISSTLQTIPSCLTNQPTIRAAVQKKQNLQALEKRKNDRRFFYALRQKKRAANIARGIERVSSAKSQSLENSVTGDVLLPNRSDLITTRTQSCDAVKAKRRATQPKDKLTQSYGNFVKGEVLLPNKSDKIKTRTLPNVTPNYDNWDIRSLLFSMKTVSVTDAKALATISKCDGQKFDLQQYAVSVFYLKNRCPELKREQVPRLYKLVLEKLQIDDTYVSSISVKGDLFDRVSVRDHGYYYNSSNHLLCTH